MWRQSKNVICPSIGFSVPICTGRVEAKQRLELCIELCTVPICTGRVEAKAGFANSNFERQRFQSARGVWRQRSLPMIASVVRSVPICTGRVEAKVPRGGSRGVVQVAICTERVEAKLAGLYEFSDVKCCNLHGACGGKGQHILCLHYRSCCNLHGACGGKARPALIGRGVLRCNLHGACGGKGYHFYTCKAAASCNLHGACGGKGWLRKQPRMKTCCNLHGACGGKERLSASVLKPFTLQSARSVWRQRCATRGVTENRRVAICTERVEAKGCSCADKL